MIPPPDDDMVRDPRGGYGDDGTILDDWPDPDPPGAGGGTLKIYVDGVSATIVAERVEYLDENGKLVTESLRDFTKRALRKRFRQPRRLPEALERRRTQAGHSRRAGCRGSAA